jgi:20S proteasome alpha/beta subunit
MRKTHCIFLTLFLFYTTMTNSQIVSKGSFSIGAICKDGIVIGADTRGGFGLPKANGVPDFDKEPQCYYDTIQKVFAIKNFIFCSTGQVTFGDKFFYFYLKEFEATLKDDATTSNGKIDFLQFIYAKYPSQLEAFLRLKMIIAGYENNKPQLCIVQNSRWDCIVEGYAVTDSLCEFDKVYSVNYTCKEMAGIIEKNILAYAKKYNKTSTIGGPIMILQIKPDNSFIWLNHKPIKQNWLDFYEFYSAYKKHTIKIHFKSEKSKQIFIESMKPYSLRN